MACHLEVIALFNMLSCLSLLLAALFCSPFHLSPHLSLYSFCLFLLLLPLTLLLSSLIQSDQ